MYISNYRIDDSLINRIPIIIGIVSIIAIRGYKKGSLNQSGVIAAWLTGVVTCICGATLGVTLLSFFLSSSYLTKYKSSIKKKIEDHHVVGGQRNYIQVLSNSLPATFWALIYYLFTNRSTTIINFNYDYFTSFILCSFIGHYACCNGDTWASELGILSKNEPILITTLKRVPKGTNGGLSSNGLLASLAGGFFIGLMFNISTLLFSSGGSGYDMIPTTNYQFISILTLSTISGLLGSLIDSLMGATLQLSLYSINRKVVLNDVKKLLPIDKETKLICGIDLLDNHQVNFLSSLLTSILSGYIGYLIF